MTTHAFSGGFARRIVSAVAAIAVAATLAGCKQSVDLGAVRDLAASAAGAKETLNALAADFFETCVRRNVYASVSTQAEMLFPQIGTANITSSASGSSGGEAPIDLVTLASETPEQLAKRLTPDVAKLFSERQLLILMFRSDAVKIFTAMSPDALKALPQAPAFAGKSPAGAACADAKRASQDWQNANGIVIAYFVALGKLAGNAPGGDRFGVKALAQSVHESSLVSKDQAATLGTFANDALQAIFDAKRRGELSKFIPEADKSVGGAIDTLESFAGQYTFVLSLERKEMDRFLRRNLRVAKPGIEAFAALQYSDEWARRTQAIDARAGAVQSYTAAWEKLRKSHTELLKATLERRSAERVCRGEGVLRRARARPHRDQESVLEHGFKGAMRCLDPQVIRCAMRSPASPARSMESSTRSSTG